MKAFHFISSLNTELPPIVSGVILVVCIVVAIAMINKAK